ncbi:thioredoxin domain-containing protein 2 [Echinops telfairi]|uniref:Thioredoxin domain-containing protein 2 n=1 Tax=Echinops telfairi TaxID=9371 RepID=A0AC55CZS4_ECHTE|nr:thioredoxin domain-containing protein 2 [Echinops telfairi]
MESDNVGTMEELKMRPDHPEEINEDNTNESPLHIMSSNVDLPVPELSEPTQAEEKALAPKITITNMPNASEVLQPAMETPPEVVEPKEGKTPEFLEQTIQSMEGATLKPSEQAIEPMEGAALKPSEQAIETMEGAALKPSEQTIKTMEGAALKPSEQSIKTMEGAALKPSEQAIETMESAALKPSEQAIEPMEGAALKPSEQTIETMESDTSKPSEETAKPLEGDKVKTIQSKEDFEANLKEAGEKLVVVDFSATWCGPCKVIKPLLYTLSNKYDDVVFLEVDVDECEELIKDFGIVCIPTFQFYRKEGKVGEFCGALKEKLEAVISELK